MSAILERIKLLKDQITMGRLYRKVFQTPEGDEVLQHMMKECGILNPRIVTDPNLLLVQQGQRRVVLSILRIIGRDPRDIQKQIEQSLQQENPYEKQHSTDA